MRRPRGLEYGDIAISGYADSLLPDSDRRCACTLLHVAGLQVLRRFEERGLVEQAYRALRVVDAAGLKEIAEARQR